MAVLSKDDRLGKFVIRERIGAGGMGVVYRARDTVIERDVAIKILKTDDDPESLARFPREAVAISRLDHPHIVKIHDFVPTENPPYIVMEYLRGTDLERLIKTAGPLPITRAVDIILDAADAVSKCHRVLGDGGYLHRDLKPTNIFIANYDGLEVTKVLDFGVAKVWGQRTAGLNPEITRHGALVGTIDYLAPEVLEGAQATPETDQYALGIVLYYAITGRKPFVVEDDNDEFRDHKLYASIRNGAHPTARALRPEISERLTRAIEIAMARDPRQRHPSVHAFGAAIVADASPLGRERWSAHFTAVPRPIRAQSSSAILIPSAHELPTVVGPHPYDPDHAATVVENALDLADPTRELDSQDLIPLGSSSPSDHHDPRPTSPGSVVDAAPSSAELSEHAAPADFDLVPASRRRRLALIAVGAAALLVIGGAALSTQRTRARRAAAPPPELLQHSAAESFRPTSPARPPSPQPQPIALPPIPSSESRPAATQPAPPPEVPRPKKKPVHRRPRVDEHGILIPSE